MTWTHFCGLVCKRFAAKGRIDVADSFRSLQQTGIVLSYVDKFEEVMARVKRSNPNLREEYFLNFFYLG